MLLTLFYIRRVTASLQNVVLSKCCILISDGDGVVVAMVVVVPAILLLLPLLLINKCEMKELFLTIHRTS